jgi:hypothetical protein
MCSSAIACENGSDGRTLSIPFEPRVGLHIRSGNGETGDFLDRGADGARYQDLAAARDW